MLKIHGRAAVVVPDNVLFEGGRRREGPPQAAAGVRRPHAAAAADRHLLRAGRQGERPLLRPQARREGAVDEEGLDLRPAAPTSTSRSRRSRMARADLDEFVACYHPANRHQRKATWDEKKPRGPLARVHLRRDRRPRQVQPRHLLAEGREPGGLARTCPSRTSSPQEIADDLRSALEQIEDILGDLERRVSPRK